MFNESENDLIFINKWETPYDEILKLQLEAQEFVLNNPEKKVIITCSHPSCFTLGRGKESKNFNENNLPYPIHQIHRGGGMTFHYPGQWVFYPIIKIDHHKISLKEHIAWIFKLVQKSAKENFNLELEDKLEPLGLWHENKKIASLGIGLNKFVTTHGIALNIFNNEEMFNFLKSLNPCGLSGSTYTNLEEQIGQISFEQFEKFHNNVINQIIQGEQLEDSRAY